VRDATRAARSIGKSLDQVVGEYLSKLTSCGDAIRDTEEMRRLSAQTGGQARGWKFDRDDLHDRV
jgi:hypothetical protein